MSGPFFHCIEMQQGAFVRAVMRATYAEAAQ